MSSNLADYNVNQDKKRQQAGGGNIADAFGAQMPASGAPGGNIADAGAPPPTNPYPGSPMPAPPPATNPYPGTPQVTQPGGGAGHAPPPVDQQPPNAAAAPGAAPAPGAPASGAKAETLGGMNGVRLANGDWVPADHPAAVAAMGQAGQVYPGGAPAAPGAPGAADAVPGAPGATPPPAGPPTTVADAFKKTLLDKLNQGPASLDDPALKGQADAFSVAQTRAKERARSTMAERASADGGVGVNSGAFDRGLVGLEQAQGESEAGFNANLLGDAAKRQADEIRQYIAIAGNQINADEARKLQDKLAQLDSDTRRYGIDKQSALGEGDLSLRGRLGEGQLNLGLLGTLLGNDYNNRALGQQGAQFGQSLDTQTILGLLGGL